MRVILFSMVVSLVGCVTPEERSTSSEENAVSWALEMGVNVEGASCMGVDSDGDGYVSCTVNTGQERIALDCSYYYPLAMFGQNTGCRQTRPITVMDGN